MYFFKAFGHQACQVWFRQTGTIYIFMKNCKFVLESSLSSKDFFWQPVQRACSDLLANIELVAFHPHLAILLWWCKCIAYEGLVWHLKQGCTSRVFQHFNWSHEAWRVHVKQNQEEKASSRTEFPLRQAVFHSAPSNYTNLLHLFRFHIQTGSCHTERRCCAEEYQS